MWPYNDFNKLHFSSFSSQLHAKTMGMPKIKVPKIIHNSVVYTIEIYDSTSKCSIIYASIEVY